MLLSMADHFARPENQPRFTMLFVAFGGEEAGLVGSTYFASKAPVVPLANIRFLLNLDLMSNGSEGIMAVAGNENPIELQVLRGLNDTLQAVKEVKSRPNAANSDHYPFVSRGVKGIFIYTMGGPPHYHDVNDTFANMEFQRYSEIRALLIRFLSELMQAQ
jgi:aminopeptidase YwaD